MKPACVPIRREQYLIFIAGLFVGVIIHAVWKRFITLDYQVYVVPELESRHAEQNSSERLAEPNAHQFSSDTRHAAGAQSDETGKKYNNNDISRIMYDNVRILCWIMTGPQDREKRARSVEATWAKRCNKFVLMSSRAISWLPSIIVNVAEGRNALWGKTKRAYEWCYDNHLDDFDWFLKADDDTYVVMENLRFLLSNHSPEEPVYYGKRFEPFTKQGYMSGGADYVLSREALRRFIETGLRKPNGACKGSDNSGAEDVEMGKCLDAVGVTAGDSRDELKRGRFFPFSLEHHLTHKHDPNFWYWKYTMDDEKLGFDCCSDFAVTFHYIKPNQMYLYDYLIYYLRPYGIAHKYKLPRRIAQLEHKPVASITAK